MAFNQGRPYHGSEAVTEGQLMGATGETDYFHFICPKCRDGHLMRILDHGYHERPSPVAAYPDEKPKQAQDFTLAFKLYCPACKLTDFVKIGNTGFQGGQLRTIQS